MMYSLPGLKLLGTFGVEVVKSQIITQSVDN